MDLGLKIISDTLQEPLENINLQRKDGTVTVPANSTVTFSPSGDKVAFLLGLNVFGVLASPNDLSIISDRKGFVALSTTGSAAVDFTNLTLTNTTGADFIVHLGYVIASVKQHGQC